MTKSAGREASSCAAGSAIGEGRDLLVVLLLMLLMLMLMLGEGLVVIHTERRWSRLRRRWRDEVGVVSRPVGSGEAVVQAAGVGAHRADVGRGIWAVEFPKFQKKRSPSG
jgi:hypothetical protein